MFEARINFQEAMPLVRGASMTAHGEIKPTDLRVALFSGNYNYVRDGANAALNRLVAHLEQRGVTVRVYSPTSDTPAFEPAGTLVSVPSVPIPRRKEYRLALGLPASIRRDLDAFQPNLVHISAPDFLGQKAVKYARSRGLPVVASVHTRFETYLSYYHLGWLEGLLSRKIGALYNRCDEIYVPGDCMGDVMRATGVTTSIKMWSRGVDTDLFHPSRRDMEWRRSLGFSDDTTVVSFVGRLVLEKGLDLFAASIERLKDMGVKAEALIVGEGPEREWFAERMPGAVFTGFQRGENLARAYASSDIFLNPSTTETFGNVTLEAMAAGVPAVCANATGSNFLVQDGKTGYLVDPTDVNAYADRMAAIARDPALAKALSEASRARSLEFTWDSILENLLGHYIDLLGRRRAEEAQQAAV
ncbi:glycosyltransferase family 1 protein [Gimibacter soli]|uniref:Glycosyltransferase family 1 protein n=1 Tax=Gimibacter soli TaxID=3024400 RepID=A0AAE9XSC2_9PROT|nr:glycosyltransferase family 1 protein [Gimibacter soli]WCL55406.1 glycosyltransferase family 1 protein [Gimibacter soli]